MSACSTVVRSLLGGKKANRRWYLSVAPCSLPGRVPKDSAWVTMIGIMRRSYDVAAVLQKGVGRMTKGSFVRSHRGVGRGHLIAGGRRWGFLSNTVTSTRAEGGGGNSLGEGSGGYFLGRILMSSVGSAPAEESLSCTVPIAEGSRAARRRKRVSAGRAPRKVSASSRFSAGRDFR